MTKLEKIKMDAVLLSPRQKEGLVQFLVQAQTGDFHPDVKESWMKELRRRVKAVRSGKAKLIAHDTVMAGLRKKLR